MIIGTCSLCGGPVRIDMEGCAYCTRCGAHQAKSYGPVIPMIPPEPPNKTIPDFIPGYPYKKTW